MTDRELKKLSRAELLEMLLSQTRQVEKLRSELAQAQAQLEDRRIKLSESGSIAEASLKLSGIFEAAQDAADQYLRNVREQEAATQERCRQMEEQTRSKCEEMTRSAREEAAGFWNEIQEKIHDPFLESASWQEILRILDKKAKQDS